MKKVTLAGHDLEIYDSIDELPVIRFHKYNKMLLIDSGIGSDLADFDSHVERAIRYCRTKPELAAAELDNLRQNVYFIQQEISPKHLAFCVLVRSINGEPFNDLSDDGLKGLLERLNQASNKEMTAHLETVKKKIDDELSVYFPKVFDDATIKEYYDQLRKRTLLILESIIKGESKESEIDEITGLLLTFAKPMIFHGEHSTEIQYDKQFESMCLLLSQQLHVNPKKFTLMEYYNAFDYLKEQAKPKKGKGAKSAL